MYMRSATSILSKVVKYNCLVRNTTVTNMWHITIILTLSILCVDVQRLLEDHTAYQAHDIVIPYALEDLVNPSAHDIAYVRVAEDHAHQ